MEHKIRLLSKTQQEVLSKMEEGKWYCSYDLGCKISTMDALRKKGYVVSRGQDKPGVHWSPQTTIEYKR